MLVTRGGTVSAAVSSLAARPPVAVAIGNFDGVHRGHQAILARLKRAAAERGITSCVLTFEPHPREYFERHRRPAGPATAAPTRLTSLREKLELLAEQGVERVHVQRFDRAFASLSPQDFVAKVLAGTLRARWVLVGDDFRFGAGRTGDIALLRDLAAPNGFELEVMGAFSEGGVRISSGAVRDALARGDLERAALLLGRPYSISGRVVHGDKLGRELGFRTANIQMKHNRPPLQGIFAVRVHGAGEGARGGVASLGVRPTVKSGGEAVLEVHLFDFGGDLYGRHLRVEFLRKIRDEEKFPDLEALQAAIARDCAVARRCLEMDGIADG